MLKKSIFSIITSFLLFSSFIYSQETQLQQYQTFSWAAVQNARKYEVDVEKLQADETWKHEASKITSSTRLEMLLYPGKYRVSIGAFNVLNKKASQSEWVSFIILGETEPFIFDSTFEKQDNNIGSLYTKPAIANTESIEYEQSSQDLTKTSSQDTTQNEQINIYPQNSFHIKGKNIYFAETEFSLVPINPDSSLTDAITSYTVDRPEVKLEILTRDSTNNEVVVSYDESQLYTGLYKLVVKNPGDLTTSINVNVYTSQLCEISPKQYDYNRRYKVNTFELSRSKESEFIINGKNFSSDSEFSLIPAEGIPYPYASIAKRVSVPLTVNNFSEANKKDKSTTLSFSFNPSAIETGYYLFSADYGKRGNVTELLLITVLPDQSTEQPNIQTIKSKLNKKLQQLEFTISGTQLDSDARGVLVSSCSEDDGTNERHELNLIDFSNNKKKLIMTVSTENLIAGTYAFLLETNGCQVIKYVSIDDKHKVNLEDMSEDKVDELFLRPEEMEIAENINIGKVELSNAKLNLDINNWELQTYIKYIQNIADSYYKESTLSNFINDPISTLTINTSLNPDDYPTGNGDREYLEYVYCRNISEELNEKLQTGDSIRIKLECNRINQWGIRFVCKDTDEKETIYDCPFKKYAELRSENDNSYYCVEGKYDELWDTTWDFKAKKPFNAENVTEMYLYANVTLYNSSLTILDFEVFDSSTIPTKLIKINPHVLTNGQLRLGGTSSLLSFDDIAFSFGGNLTLLDFKNISSEVLYLHNITDSIDNLETSIKIKFASGLIEPYIGGGIGFYHIGDYYIYIPLYTGIKLLRIFDFRYNCNLNNINYEQRMFFKDSFSLGLSLWFKTQKIKRVPKEIKNE